MQNIDRLPPACFLLGTEPTSQACALPGNCTCDLLAQGLCSTTEPHQPRLGPVDDVLFFFLLFFNESSRTPHVGLCCVVGIPQLLLVENPAFPGEEVLRYWPSPTWAEQRTTPMVTSLRLVTSRDGGCSRLQGKLAVAFPSWARDCEERWSCEFHRDCPGCALTCLLVSCLFSSAHGDVPWAAVALPGRGPWPGSQSGSVCPASLSARSPPPPLAHDLPMTS